MTYRSSAVLLLVALPGVLAGCSSEKKSFTLKGTVSYQEKPLSAGVVRLYMADNRQAMARIQPDGSFEATNVFAGEAKVTIGDDPADMRRRTMPIPKGVPMARFPKPSPVPLPSIPAKYKDVSTTDLIFPLQAGTPLNIELR